MYEHVFESRLANLLNCFATPSTIGVEKCTKCYNSMYTDLNKYHIIYIEYGFLFKHMVMLLIFIMIVSVKMNKDCYCTVTENWLVV